jgi:hypothetical protein
MTIPWQLFDADSATSSRLACHHQPLQPAATFNLITTEPHARGSPLLYNLKVGIIGLEGRQYDFRHWCIAGVREIIGQTIANVYARRFFQPLR